MTNSTTDIDLLAHALSLAKIEERHAKNLRIDAERALIDAIGVLDEGSTSQSGHVYKITTTGNIYRTIDQALLEDIHAHIGGDLFSKVFRRKYDLVTPEFRTLKEQGGPAFLEVCRAVTEKPGKPSVSIEAI